METGRQSLLFIALHTSELLRSSLPPLQTQSQERKLDSDLQPHTKTGRVVHVHQRAVYLRGVSTTCDFRLGLLKCGLEMMMMMPYYSLGVPKPKTGAGGV